MISITPMHTPAVVQTLMSGKEGGSTHQIPMKRLTPALVEEYMKKGCVSNVMNHILLDTNASRRVLC